MFHFFDSFRPSVHHCAPCPEAAPAACYIHNGAARGIRERQFPAACGHKPAQERSIGQVVRRTGNKRLPAHQQYGPAATLSQSGVYGLQFFRPRLPDDEQQRYFTRRNSGRVSGCRSQKLRQGNRPIVCAKLIQISGNILRGITFAVRLRGYVGKAQGHARPVWPTGRKGLHHRQSTVETRHCAGMHGRLQLIVHVVRIFLRHMAGDFGRFIVVMALQRNIQHAFQRVALYGVAGKQAFGMRLRIIKERSVGLKRSLTAGAQLRQFFPFLRGKAFRIKRASGNSYLFALELFKAVSLHPVLIAQGAVVQRLHIGGIRIIGQIGLRVAARRRVAGFSQCVFGLTAQSRKFFRIWQAALLQNGSRLRPAVLGAQSCHKQWRHRPCGCTLDHERTENRLCPTGIAQGKGALPFIQPGGRPCGIFKFAVKRAGAGVVCQRHKNIENCVPCGKIAGFRAQKVVKMTQSHIRLPFKYPDAAKNEFMPGRSIDRGRVQMNLRSCHISLHGGGKGHTQMRLGQIGAERKRTLPQRHRSLRAVANCKAETSFAQHFSGLRRGYALKLPAGQKFGDQGNILLIQQLAQIFRQHGEIERPAQLQLPCPRISGGNTDRVAFLRRIKGEQGPGAGFHCADVAAFKRACGKGQRVPWGIGARGGSHRPQQRVSRRPLLVLYQIQGKREYGHFRVLHAEKFHGVRSSALLQQDRTHGGASLLPMLGVKSNGIAPRNIGIVYFSAVPQLPAVVAHEFCLLLLRGLRTAEPKAGDNQPDVVLRVNSADIVHMLHNGLPGFLHGIPVFALPGEQEFAKIYGNVIAACLKPLLKRLEFGGFSGLGEAVIELPLQIQVVRGNLCCLFKYIAGILDAARGGVGICSAHGPDLRAGSHSPALLVNRGGLFLLVKVQVGLRLDGVQGFLTKAPRGCLPIKSLGFVLLASQLQGAGGHGLKHGP